MILCSDGRNQGPRGVRGGLLQGKIFKVRGGQVLTFPEFFYSGDM